jgi:hypothetical protein
MSNMITSFFMSFLTVNLSWTHYLCTNLQMYNIPNSKGSTLQGEFPDPSRAGFCSAVFEVSSTWIWTKCKRRVFVKLQFLPLQRFSSSVLASRLEPKYEYVISVRLSEVQTKAYQYYWDNCDRGKDLNIYHNLSRICTHPRALQMRDAAAETEVRWWITRNYKPQIKADT